MRKIKEYHIPVLLKETIDLLRVEPGKKYIDATLGGGGHSEEILKRGGKLLGIDRDPQAVESATARLNQACPPPKVVWGNFENIEKIAEENSFCRVDGILFDLGVSSHQLETPQRGFSFNQEGPLDMRMDPRLTVAAKDLVNGLTEKELEELFTKLGEEKFARRYAHAMVEYRKRKELETCDEVANIILRVAPARGKFDRTHPATRVFQALRIAVNDELNGLKMALPKAVGLLNRNGRIVVLSFHSLEDGIVKRFFSEKQKEGILKIINDKPISPGEEEIKANPRSRSAKLRVAEKL